MTAPSRATSAGRAYLDLRAKARGDRSPVDELLQLYILESFLARLAESRFADQLVLKGGVLLAAFGERRPTRDVDLQAEALDNDEDNVRTVICEVANLRLDDGVAFDVDGATAAEIRDVDAYSGVRVTMSSELATARPHFHVDVNVGDPITPAPQELHIPRLLGGEVVVRGYPLVMVHAEKIVTAVARGTVNTRWRDFADVYLLSGRHPQNRLTRRCSRGGRSWVRTKHVPSTRSSAHWATPSELVICYPVPTLAGQSRGHHRAVLSRSLDLPPGQTLAGLVTTERIGTWIDAARHPMHQEWRSAVANGLPHPIETPSNPGDVVAPMRWLLELAAERG